MTELRIPLVVMKVDYDRGHDISDEPFHHLDHCLGEESWTLSSVPIYDTSHGEHTDSEDLGQLIENEIFHDHFQPCSYDHVWEQHLEEDLQSYELGPKFNSAISNPTQPSSSCLINGIVNLKEPNSFS